MLLKEIGRDVTVDQKVRRKSAVSVSCAWNGAIESRRRLHRVFTRSTLSFAPQAEATK
jgi:hypothetical protein